MISILMPVFNTKKEFLIQSINSCLKQTFKEFEIIIVNNESTLEETIDTLEFFKNNKKIKIFDCPRKDKKKNLSVALNFGLNLCKYEYIARMDSDDIMMPDRLEKQIKYMLENPEVDILGGQIYIIPNNTRTNHPNVVNKELVLKTDWLLNHPTVMFKKSKITNIGGYFEDYEHFGEDYELWLRSLINRLKIHNIADIVLFYRTHENNLTEQTKKNPNYFHNMNKIFNNFLQIYDSI